MADEKPIWQRLETDTNKSFEAFCQYRDMGADRSLEKVGQKLGKSKSLLERWSSSHEWAKRATAYDEWVSEEHSRELLKRQKTVQSNEWNDYLAIRNNIDRRLQVFKENEWANPDTDSIVSLTSLMKQAADIGRRAVGLPEKITENKQEHSGSITWEQVVTEARGNLDDNDPFA